MNSVNLIGNMVADADIKEGQNNSGATYKRASFTIAVNRMGEGVDYIRCLAWGKQAEQVEKWFPKGTKIGITGHLKYSSYQDKEGRKRSSIDVEVERITFASSKAERNNRDGSVGVDAAEAFVPIDDDILF